MPQHRILHVLLLTLWLGIGQVTVAVEAPTVIGWRGDGYSA
jgi:hypothetical protein